MKKLFFAVAIAAAGLMTGCAVNEHLTGNRNVMQTNVELSQNNFQVTGTVKGSASVTRIFGIGGISSKAVKANAYAEMVKNANLSGSQALINVTTEVKNRGFMPFYWRSVVTTHGQVVEFVSPEERTSGHAAAAPRKSVPSQTKTIETTESRAIYATQQIIDTTKIYYTTYRHNPISVHIERDPHFVSNDYVDDQGVIAFQGNVIPEKAFSGCTALDTITIPEDIVGIQDFAFARCSYLKMIYCRPTTPPELGYKVFSAIPRDARIYVPRNSVDKYKSTFGWQDFASRIVGYDFK